MIAAFLIPRWPRPVRNTARVPRSESEHTFIRLAARQSLKPVTFVSHDIVGMAVRQDEVALAMEPVVFPVALVLTAVRKEQDAEAMAFSIQMFADVFYVFGVQ